MKQNYASGGECDLYAFTTSVPVFVTLPWVAVIVTDVSEVTLAGVNE
jgi:hypothetical protein